MAAHAVAGVADDPDHEPESESTRNFDAHTLAPVLLRDRPIVEKELGCTIEEVFKDFAEKPLGAASIGQVPSWWCGGQRLRASAHAATAFAHADMPPLCRGLSSLASVTAELPLLCLRDSLGVRCSFGMAVCVMGTRQLTDCSVCALLQFAQHVNHEGSSRGIHRLHVM